MGAPTPARALAGPHVAVDVVARRVTAEPGAVRLPPAARERAGWATVRAGDGAAHLGVAVAALRTARARRPAARADRGVRGGGPEDVHARRGDKSGARDRAAHEEPAPVGARREEARYAVDERRHVVSTGRSSLIDP